METDKKDVLVYLTSLRDFLKELISITKSILNLIWNNKRIILLFLIIYLVYLGLNYVAYEMPKRTITKYYSLVDNQKLIDAWGMLTPQCKVRWKDGEKDFKVGYATLATTNILNIDNYNPSNLFEAISSDKKQLIVDIIVLENFRYYDLFDKSNLQEKKEQLDNQYWLRLRHSDALLSKLKTDSLSANRNALKLVRRYRKIFTIQKNPDANLFDWFCSNNWLISDVDNKEIGIIFDTTFYYK